MQITSGKIPTAIKCLIYGPEGIGKSTFASQWPKPLYIDTEGSTVHMDVRRLPKPDLWVELLEEVKWVLANPGECGTLVLDTADWAETLCNEYVCARDKKTGIEDYGYGKGYVYAAEEFGRLPNLFDQLIAKGINVVICCHAQMRKFEQPDEMGAYDRWELKLSKKVGPMLREWADMVLFANYKTIVVNVDGQGAAKGKNKVQGGMRVMYTSHHPCWDAKNRFGLNEELQFDYNEIRGVVEGTLSAPCGGTSPSGGGKEGPKPLSDSSALAQKAEEVAKGKREATSSDTTQRAAPHSPEGKDLGGGKGSGGGQAMREAAAIAQEAAGSPQTPLEAAATNSPPESQMPPGAARAADVGSEYAGLPAPVARMMQEAQVLPDEVRHVIAQKGIYPPNTPWSVICDNEQFVKGWLMHPNVWPKVVNAVMENRASEEVPF